MSTDTSWVGDGLTWDESIDQANADAKRALELRCAANLKVIDAEHALDRARTEYNHASNAYQRADVRRLRTIDASIQKEADRLNDAANLKRISEGNQ